MEDLTQNLNFVEMLQIGKMCMKTCFPILLYFSISRWISCSDQGKRIVKSRFHFAHWIMKFFYRCSFNPYKMSICDLLLRRDLLNLGLNCPTTGHPIWVVSHLLCLFVDKVGAFFSFVEKKSSTLGFTPLYQSLSESLVEMHKVVLEAVSRSHRLVRFTKILGHL